MRRLTKDDSRRTRKQLPLPQHHPLSSMSQPLLCHPYGNALSTIGSVSSTSSHHTNSLARQSGLNESHEYTTAQYHFADEKIPYRVKIPSKLVTLKLFKEHLPKKGNFR